MMAFMAAPNAPKEVGAPKKGDANAVNARRPARQLRAKLRLPKGAYPQDKGLPSQKMLNIIGEKIPQDVDMSDWESL
ncbi:hypothetical protein MWN52_13535 [Pseudoxanthomonas winnipegensis]|uniref:hypothetical protein n=1 Tax=Pseudoxanthomonas winnipegensis TaxID=2480810 RepID=UPI00257602C4|nr:hypothetical protein [Pseudoxanthomonas winnipegensis]WJI14642.1 hypothetical protein MWN52_13535 [Pseudoxanthomonas winnipegensis]